MPGEYRGRDGGRRKRKGMAIIGRPLYDIAIMEAGPAGASLAFFLSRKGLRTFLWDRAEPGERPVCGGLPVALGSGAALAQRLSEGLNRRRPGYHRDQVSMVPRYQVDQVSVVQ